VWPCTTLQNWGPSNSLLHLWMAVNIHITQITDLNPLIHVDVARLSQNCNHQQAYCSYSSSCVYGAPVEWYLQGKTKNVEENLTQCHSVHKSYMDPPGHELQHPKWEASDKLPEPWHSLLNPLTMGPLARIKCQGLMAYKCYCDTQPEDYLKKHDTWLITVKGTD
jgi:hypothetical protein